MNPLRWLGDLVSFIRWMRTPSQDAGFFGMMEDDPTLPDELGGRTKQRIFLSFARPSLDLARRVEGALASQHVEVDPWRYEPSDALPEVDTRSAENFVAQMERFEQDHPGVAERLERTLRRCVGYVFIVSPSSIRSAICDFEALVASMRFKSDRHRVPVWVLLEEAGLEQQHLSGFRTIVYKPGIETALASHIAAELDGLRLNYPSRFI